MRGVWAYIHVAPSSLQGANEALYSLIDVFDSLELLAQQRIAVRAFGGWRARGPGRLGRLGCFGRPRLFGGRPYVGFGVL